MVTGEIPRFDTNREPGSGEGKNREGGSVPPEAFSMHGAIMGTKALLNFISLLGGKMGATEQNIESADMTSMTVMVKESFPVMELFHTYKAMCNAAGQIEPKGVLNTMFFKSVESVLLICIKASEAGLTGAVTLARQVQLGKRYRNIKVCKGGKGELTNNVPKSPWIIGNINNSLRDRPEGRGLT